MKNTIEKLLVLGGCCVLPLAGHADTFTAVTGISRPFENTQPTLDLNQLIVSFGIYPSHDGGTAGEAVMGMVRTFAWGQNSAAPAAPAAAGQFLAINQNQALFSILGTTYGGDGRTNFALPDLAGRITIGMGQGPGLSRAYLGQELGAASTSMSQSQMPTHVHALPSSGFAGSSGGSQAIDNMQPSLTLNYVIAVDGVYPFRDGGTGGGEFLGEIRSFAGNFAPGGYMPADGRLMPINQYTALFSILGTTYGGDGRSTFALPDLRGRTIIGTGMGAGLTDRVTGEQTGSEQITLTQNHLPAHVHGLPPAGQDVTAATGGGQPFDTMQPSLAMSLLIATEGIFPGHDRALPGETVIGEVVAFAGNYAPEGSWSFADGRLLPISENEALFSLIGTTYGGDGQTTFALPDLRGRTIAGVATNSALLGRMSGQENVTLSVSELAAHVHTAPVPEPESYAMLLAGLGLLGVMARHRRRRLAS